MRSGHCSMHFLETCSACGRHAHFDICSTYSSAGLCVLVLSNAASALPTNSSNIAPGVRGPLREPQPNPRGIYEQLRGRFSTRLGWYKLGVKLL